MIIQPEGTRSLRLAHLIATLTNCETFQKLVGAESASEAAGSVYVDLALDDDTEPFPRAIIRHVGSQAANRDGIETFVGQGDMGVFIQYEQISNEALAAWYDTSGDFTIHDKRQHMNNIFGKISDEMMALATEEGCLEFAKLEEFSCGDLDPVTENGVQLVELTWVLHRDGGLP